MEYSKTDILEEKATLHSQEKRKDSILQLYAIKYNKLISRTEQPTTDGKKIIDSYSPPVNKKQQINVHSNELPVKATVTILSGQEKPAVQLDMCMPSEQSSTLGAT